MRAASQGMGRWADRRQLVALLMVLLLVGCQGAQGSARDGAGEGSTLPAEVGTGEMRVGEPAPTFRLPAQDGRVVDLAELKGEPVILNFWATWCGPCRVEMPELQAAYEQYQDEGLHLIGVEVASSGSAEESAAFLDEVGVTFPTYRDTDNAMEDAYLKRPALPTTVFIDREGIVRYVQLGPVTNELIQEQLDALGL